MKHGRILFTIILLSGILPGACTHAGLPASTATSPAVSATHAPPASDSPTSRVTREISATPTPLPTVTPSLTPAPPPSIPPTATSAPCDPSLGYCLESGHFLLDRPIASPGVNKIEWAYPYGSTEDGTRDPHHGVEFHNPTGTPVLAAADGQVLVAGNDSQTNYGLYKNGYGNLIILEHHFSGFSQPVFTVYGHLSKVEVQVGQTVRSGQEIGKVGSSGAAIGSHLHFEVRLGQNSYDSNRNPVLWLKPLTGTDGNSFGAIAGRLVDDEGNLIYTQDLTIQYFLDPKGAQTALYGVETYAPEEHPVGKDDTWEENFALGDLPSGHYRITMVWNGRLYIRWVDVIPGMLTLITFSMNS